MNLQLQVRRLETQAALPPRRHTPGITHLECFLCGSVCMRSYPCRNLWGQYAPKPCPPAPCPRVCALSPGCDAGPGRAAWPSLWRLSCYSSVPLETTARHPPPSPRPCRRPARLGSAPARSPVLGSLRSSFASCCLAQLNVVQTRAELSHAQSSELNRIFSVSWDLRGVLSLQNCLNILLLHSDLKIVLLISVQCVVLCIRVQGCVLLPQTLSCNCFSRTLLLLMLLAAASRCYFRAVCEGTLSPLMPVGFFPHTDVPGPLSDVDTQNPVCVERVLLVSIWLRSSHLEHWKADLLSLLLFLGTRTGLVPRADVCGRGRRAASDSTHPVVLQAL